MLAFYILPFIFTISHSFRSFKSSFTYKYNKLSSLSIDSDHYKVYYQQLLPDDEFSVTLIQKLGGVTPHPTETAELKIAYNSINFQKSKFTDAIYEGIQTFLDMGGRLSQIRVIAPFSMEISQFLKDVGLCEDESVFNENRDNLSFSIEASRFMKYCQNKVLSSSSFTLCNILGRMSHEARKFDDAIKFYTLALQLKPTSPKIFCHLGSVYHERGDLKLAFASYQQVIELNPKDYTVYLKLAYLYEDLGKKGWQQAPENAKQCYQYYLLNAKGDISALTRYGNFLVRNHLPNEAIEVYKDAIAIDASLSSLWFNKAYAEVKAKLYVDAKSSFEQSLKIDPSLHAASHMLKAIDEELSVRTSSAELKYVVDLFDSYASEYEEHTRTLQYNIPRLISQEIATIYNLSIAPEFVLEKNTCNEASMSIHTCESHSKHNYGLSLDILDLGCGTGMIGTWLHQFSKSLTGVDISKQMISIAKSKNIYSNLYSESIEKYLDTSSSEFDLVVAAEVFSYIGDLSTLLAKIKKHIRKGGYFIFTVETTSSESCLKGREFRLLKSGRFGYAPIYLDNLISISDYEILSSKNVTIRLEEGNPLPGLIYILKCT